MQFLSRGDNMVNSSRMLTGMTMKNVYVGDVKSNKKRRVKK